MEMISRTELLAAKPGDILWISLKASTSPDEAREFATSLNRSHLVPDGVIPLLTFDNIVANVRIASIDDIRHYRNTLDEIIASWQLNDEYAD